SASLQVTLEPARLYVVWLNNATMQGFTDDKGAPLLPFRWTFSTKGYREANLAPATQPAPATPVVDAPRVVKVSPPDGATDVDPALAMVSVTFDRAMAPEGWSWVRDAEGPFPEGAGQPSFDASGTTNTLPVKMKPGTRYIIWVNSDTHRDFQDLQGVPAIPYRWTFTTRK
ncbi:MAG: Ig-like domain-containing protein, partial [Pseudomonadota bacterium]